MRSKLYREDIAKALGMAPREAEKVIRLPGFPKPTGGRWSRADVESFWSGRKQKTRPRFTWATF
jgi:hypothetical protein